MLAILHNHLQAPYQGNGSTSFRVTVLVGLGEDVTRNSYRLSFITDATDNSISWILMMMVTDLIKRLLSPHRILFQLLHPKYSSILSSKIDLTISILISLGQESFSHAPLNIVDNRCFLLIRTLKALINKCHQVGLLSVVNLDWITKFSTIKWWVQPCSSYGDQRREVATHFISRQNIFCPCAIYEFTSWDVIKVIRSIKSDSMAPTTSADHSTLLDTETKWLKQWRWMSWDGRQNKKSPEQEH